jgi:hypothetical protein
MTQDDINDIQNSNNTDALADLLVEYCEINKLPLMSADELLLVLGAHWQWLLAFIDRWNVVQAEEDFESAIRARGEK